MLSCLLYLHIPPPVLPENYSKFWPVTLSVPAWPECPNIAPGNHCFQVANYKIKPYITHIAIRKAPILP